MRLSAKMLTEIPEQLKQIINYRKSGLSLNHIVELIDLSLNWKEKFKIKFEVLN